MVYTANVPNSSQKQNASQPILLANFQSLDTSFAVNHYAFSDNTATAGFHKKVTLTELAAPTGAVSNAQGILYARTVNSEGRLFFYNGTKDYQLAPCLTIGAANVFKPNIASYYSINVSSIDHAANSGIFKLNFTNNFANKNYGVQAYFNSASSAASDQLSWRISAQEVNYITFTVNKIVNAAVATDANIDICSIVCYTMAA